MTIKQIATMINGIGIPNRYDHFTESPAPPYLVFYFPAQNDIFADNSNYCGKAQLHVELFTAEKDFANEALVEKALSDNGLSWYKSTDFLNDELLYMTTYELEVILNG